jgi:hypothetical protein
MATVGQPDNISVAFTSPSGVAFDPPTAVKVTYAGPGQTATTKTYPTDTVVIRDGVGAYHVAIPDNLDGIWSFRWEGYDVTPDPIVAVDGSVYIFPSPFKPLATGSGVPFGTGYASVADVAARIAAGSWDPTKSNAFPTAVQTAQFLIEASADVDMVLAKSGYTVPLTPSSNAPGGVIQPQAYSILRKIASALAAGHVEMVRHGSMQHNADKQGDDWITYADDLLTRIETGDDNLTIFGAAGAFEMQPDPAGVISNGNLIYDVGTDTLLDHSGQPGVPAFTMKEQF